MRQVTGSNPHLSQYKISVRLGACGDLFVLEDAISELSTSEINKSEARAGVLCVELLTKRMMILPTEMLNSGCCSEAAECDSATIARRELSRMGISYYDDEEVVTLRKDDITALVVVPKSLIKAIEERFGGDGVEIAYEVPLLRSAAGAKEHMLVDSYRGITTIKIFGVNSAAAESKEKSVEMLFADIYETPNDASAIYWVERVASAAGLTKSTPLYIYRCSGTMRRLLQRNFNKIMVCE